MRRVLRQARGEAIAKPAIQGIGAGRSGGPNKVDRETGYTICLVSVKDPPSARGFRGHAGRGGLRPKGKEGAAQGFTDAKASSFWK